MTLLVLYLLGLLDGLLCGLRASMGRCPFIRKRSYYVLAMVRGIAGAQVVSMLALGALLVARRLLVRDDVLRVDLESGCWPYALDLSALCCSRAGQPGAPHPSVNRHSERDQCVHAWAPHGHTAVRYDRWRRLWNFEEFVARNPRSRPFDSCIDALAGVGLESSRVKRASFSDSQTGLRTRWGSESKSSRRCSMLLP